MDYSRAIIDNIETLMRCTNINVHIIALLRAKNGLTEAQQSKILEPKPLMDQCTMLYDWMKQSVELYNRFLQVMEENQQEHVANLLKGNLKGPHVPLSKEIYDRLNEKKPTLMFIIHFNEVLVSSLESKNALSRTDYQDIKYSMSTPYQKNFLLIGAVQRRSYYSFQCLEEALRETHQEKVAEYLTEGIVIPVHVNTNQPEIETQLSESINNDINEAYSSGSNSGISELNEQGIHLVASKPEKSILVFFYCKKPASVINFTGIFNSEKLTNLLKDYFNRLLIRKMTKESMQKIDELEISLSLDEEEILLIKEFTGLSDWIPRKFQKIESIRKFEGEQSHVKGAREVSQEAIKQKEIFDPERNRLSMKECKYELIDIIDSEFGLLDKLLKNNALNRIEIEKLKTEKSNCKRNEMLLDCLSQNEKHQDLLNALSESGQTHVVNWIRANGEYSDGFGLDWPLTEKENKALDYCWEQLIDILDTDVLLPLLYSNQVINKRQKFYIESQPTTHERNEALLGIIRRLSLRSYSTLTDCLLDSNQAHIADILRNSGAIVRVRATLERESLDEVEEQIVKQMTDLLVNTSSSADQVNRLLSQIQLKIIGTKRGE